MRKLAVGVLCALALLSAAQAKEERPKPPAASRNPSLNSDLEAQLAPLLKRFESAWNAHDPKAMAAPFAEDAVVINPSGRVARGRDEIQRLFEDEQVRGGMRSSQFSHRVTDVRQIAPGVAFLDSEMTITGARAPDGRALPEMQVHGALVFANQGGTWRVVEARPYVFTPPPGSPGVAGSGAPGAQPGASPQSGTGSGAAPSADAPSEPQPVKPAEPEPSPPSR